MRFRAPQPPEVNRSFIQDGSHGRACPQAVPAWQFSQSTEGFKSLTQGEDCLLLDVFVPTDVFSKTNRTSGAPVLVWIHGGGNAYGAKDYQTDPYGLMLRARENSPDGMIFVAMNYRLGAFGGLAGPTFQKDGTANVGLRDQRMALEWVQKYIHFFGGDRSRVTVMGCSAGGGSVVHQLTAYGGRSSAPFQRAIPQSPIWIPLPSPSYQEAIFQAFLHAANVSSLMELRSLSPEELMLANAALVSSSLHGQFTFGPAVDGDFVTQDPKQLLIHGQFDHRVHLLASHTSNEGKIFAHPNLTSDAAYNDFIRAYYPSADDETLEHIRTVLYPPVSNTSLYITNSERAALTISDTIVNCNAAAVRGAYSNQTYAYLFAVSPGAHAQDIPYTFYHEGSEISAAVTNTAVARAIQDLITSFAISGQPTTSIMNPPDIGIYGANAKILSLDDKVPKKRKRKTSIDVVPEKQTEAQKAEADAKMIQEFRITFHPRKYSPSRSGNVPEQHKTKFEHIQQLGQISYESYAVQPRPDITNKPWELENKRRATWVSQKAIQSRIDAQNEDGWRMALESCIFQRFEIEVACQQCRRRLWQSFVQVNPMESNSRTTTLAERQKNRLVCECEPWSKPSGILGTGMSEIFSTRIGERSVIQGDPENDHRIEMRPDRIYGLRTTDAMEKILQRPHNSYLREDPEIDELLERLTISCNPDSGGRASIYPFLVMEAKSLKSKSNFLEIERQTAVPIRNHLYLQLKLQEDEFNKMQIPGGPLSWFLAYIGEMWRVYGCYVTKANPSDLPHYNVVLLWEGSITGYDEALQLVLIVDYIVDWARDIFRPSIIRQLMSVVDKGSQSSYTIVEEPDILSIPGYANSWYGNRPAATISGDETTGVPKKLPFDAMDSTIESSLQPLFETTGKHVDIRVWEGAKYEARVRGLYITGNDTAASNHLTNTGYRRIHTVQMRRCWFLLHAQDIKTIEQAWTGSQETKDTQDSSPQRILISLYVQYRKDGDGMPIRELTYLALAESVAKKIWHLEPILQQNELIISAEELGLKLREAWASSHENYFQRYANSQTSVLCATVSDFDRLSGRVVLSFHDSRETTNYARRLNGFIEGTCENPRAKLYEVYKTCFRSTNTVHALTVEPHCALDPSQACVFINTEAMPSGICAYITNAASEEVNDAWVIRHLVSMLAVLYNSKRSDREKSFHEAWDLTESKILLWIVSDPQWDLYVTIKPTLTMPGMNKFHGHLVWFRKVLLRHRCGTGSRGHVFRRGYRNIQCGIQDACKKCKFKWWYDSDLPKFEYCDEDFMPE
ncbi:hypothetical protein yc1106_08566 [Curvularia clavata]|uniref:Carboxylesterase type B domain-containing protein n=1 Tax=Curvularia clavata TaxID=95742 RepID=A0A9Q9DVX1_CURCL|nr:hypothetical protein yc1106_08566 [Curvularia clavata]